MTTDNNTTPTGAGKRKITLAALEKKPVPPKESLLKRIWEGWKKGGLFIGKVNLYILTFVIYWSVFAITSIITILLGRDFLRIREKKDAKTFWVPMPEKVEDSLEKHFRQF